MSVDYLEKVPLSPPRPERSIPRDFLPLYERMGYLLQYKKNGTASVVYVSPDGEVSALTRHLEPHRAWSFTAESARPFEKTAGGGWNVFFCELLHSRVRGIRDVNYVHDVLVWDGKWLMGETYAQRYRRLQSTFLRKGSEMTPSHWVADEHLWLVRNHRRGFQDTFDSLEDPEDEGVVLKNPTAPLGVGSGSWSVKCRRPTKNLSF